MTIVSLFASLVLDAHPLVELFPVSPKLSLQPSRFVFQLPLVITAETPVSSILIGSELPAESVAVRSAPALALLIAFPATSVTSVFTTIVGVIAFTITPTSGVVSFTTFSDMLDVIQLGDVLGL